MKIAGLIVIGLLAATLFTGVVGAEEVSVSASVSASASAAPTAEATATPTPQASPASEATATPPGDAGKPRCRGLPPRERARCLNANADAGVDAEVKAEGEMMPPGLIISGAAQKHRECAKNADREARKNCLSQVRAELKTAIEKSQAEQRKMDDERSKKLKEKFGDNFKNVMHERAEHLANVMHKHNARMKEIAKLRAKKFSETTAEERAKYRLEVNAYVEGHFEKLSAALANLEARGVVDAELIADIKAKIAANLEAWKKTADITDAEKKREGRKAIVAKMNAEWKEFMEKIKGQLAEAEISAVVAKSNEALAKARTSIAALAEKGVETARLEKIADNIEAKISVLASGDFSFGEVRGRLHNLRAAFMHLRKAISRAANGAQFEALPAPVEADVAAEADMAAEAEASATPAPSVEAAATVQASVSATAEPTATPAAEASPTPIA